MCMKYIVCVCMRMCLLVYLLVYLSLCLVWFVRFVRSCWSMIICRCCCCLSHHVRHVHIRAPHQQYTSHHHNKQIHNKTCVMLSVSTSSYYIVCHISSSNIHLRLTSMNRSEINSHTDRHLNQNLILFFCWLKQYQLKHFNIMTKPSVAEQRRIWIRPRCDGLLWRCGEASCH